MNIAEKIRNNLQKLQSLPEQKKKIILWTIVAVLAVIMGFFWVKSAIVNVSKMGQEFQKIELPEIQMPEAPNIDLEDINLEQLNNQIQQNEEK